MQTEAKKSRRVQVRPGEYHGKQGFKITASNGPGQWPQKIFCLTRKGAAEIVDAIKGQYEAERGSAADKAFDVVIDNVLKACR